MMKIQTHCPHCEKSLKVSEELVGRKAKCPACQSPFVITAEQPTPPSLPKTPTVVQADVVPTGSVRKSSKGTTTEEASGTTRKKVITLTVAALVAIAVVVISVPLFFTMKSVSPTPRTPLATVTAVLPENPPNTTVEVESPAPSSVPDVAISEDAAVEQDVPAAVPTAVITPPKAKPTPKEIIFPKVRHFNHPSRLLTIAADGYVIQRLAAKADDNDIFFMADFAVWDFGVKGKTPTLNERGKFRIHSNSTEWQSVNPKTMTFHFNGTQLTFKTEKEASETDSEKVFIIAVFSISEFEQMLSANTIEVQIENRRFLLESRHLEALRDLASRLPDGLSRKGNFIIKHQADTPPVEEPKKIVFPKPGTLEPWFEFTRDRKPSEGQIVYGMNTFLDGDIQIGITHMTDIRDDLPDDTVIVGFGYPFTRRFGANWRSVEPKEIMILNDGKEETLELEREGDVLCVVLNLHELEGLINTKLCRIRVGGDAMSLSKYSLLAIRHFCSRLPSGKTKSGRFLVIHDGEVATQEQVEENHKPLFDTPKPFRTKKEKEMLAKKSKSDLQAAKKLLPQDPDKARKILEKIVADDPDSYSGKLAKEILFFPDVRMSPSWP